LLEVPQTNPLEVTTAQLLPERVPSMMAEVEVTELTGVVLKEIDHPVVNDNSELYAVPELFVANART
jgi:hypothetical protein